MARGRREWRPDMFNHVVMRGNNRQNIYQSPADFAEFFRCLQYAHDKYPFTIVAYCIMSNHYHLLIRSPEVPLGKVMSHINRRYSDYFKRKYNYSGFLYGSRYYAKMIADPKSLLAVSRYIHRNPIETKLPMVSKMEQYTYSSYSYYIQNWTSTFASILRIGSFAPPSPRILSPDNRRLLSLLRASEYWRGD